MPLGNDIDKLPDPLPGRTGWPWMYVHEGLVNYLPEGFRWPIISIVTPSYNQGQFIEETIRSVLLQGYPNLECIIIDGGSTDYTLEIIKKYEPWLTYWISEPDRGQSHAVNKGIREATGEILLWLNSDDMLLPSALHKVASEFKRNPETKLVIGQAHIIDVNGMVIGEITSEFTSWEDLIKTPNNRIRQISSFFSRGLFDDYGMLNEDLHIAMDSDLLARFTRYHPPTIISDYVAAFRSQPEAKSALQLLKGYKETDEIRLQTIPDRCLLAQYKKNSASNWINLSRMSRYSHEERRECLFQAVKVSPQVFLTKDYWSALKKYLMSFTA